MACVAVEAGLHLEALEPQAYERRLLEHAVVNMLSAITSVQEAGHRNSERLMCMSPLLSQESLAICKLHKAVYI